MKKAELVALLKAVTVEELQRAIPVKEKFEKLEARRKSLQKELASVVKQIESLGLPGGAIGSALEADRAGRKTSRRRISQPSLSSLIVDILKEKKKPLSINQICDALLKEKGYQTRARDFKAQIRVMMYRNDKGLFKKPRPGLFTLSADAQPPKAVKKTTRKKGTKKAGKGRTKKAGSPAGTRARKTGKKVARKAAKKTTKSKKKVKK